MFWLLTGAILLTGTADLTAIALQRRTWRYLWKPGTMLLIIALAATALPDAGGYGYLILLGLLCSVAGDIFLMLPTDRFLAGLLSFFLAHLCYVAAFTPAGSLTAADGLVAAGLLVTGGLLLRRLLPGVLEQGGQAMLLPVILYLLVISTMVLRAVMSRNPVLIIGALLFYLSDGILAWNRFVRPVRGADLAIMSTYFAAQYLIGVTT